MILQKGRAIFNKLIRFYRRLMIERGTFVSRIYFCLGIRVAEVKKAFKRMKTRKAMGPNGVPWKCLAEIGWVWLAKLFKKILRIMKLSDEWRKSVVAIYNNE